MKKILISLVFLIILTGCNDAKYQNGEVNVLN